MSGTFTQPMVMPRDATAVALQRPAQRPVDTISALPPADLGQRISGLFTGTTLPHGAPSPLLQLLGLDNPLSMVEGPAKALEILPAALKTAREKGELILHSKFAENYGMRKVVNEAPTGLKGFRAVWSNNGMDWHIVNYGTLKRGQFVDLDANEILVYAKNITEARQHASFLPELPLYGNSFEAKARAGVFGKDEQQRYFRVIEGGKYFKYGPAKE